MQRTTDTFSSAVFFVRPLSVCLSLSRTVWQSFPDHHQVKTPLSTSRLLAPTFSRDVQSMQRMLAHQCRTTKSS